MKGGIGIVKWGGIIGKTKGIDNNVRIKGNYTLFLSNCFCRKDADTTNYMSMKTSCA